LIMIRPGTAEGGKLTRGVFAKTTAGYGSEDESRQNSVAGVLLGKDGRVHFRPQISALREPGTLETLQNKLVRPNSPSRVL